MSKARRRRLYRRRKRLRSIRVTLNVFRQQMLEIFQTMPVCGISFHRIIKRESNEPLN